MLLSRRIEFLGIFDMLNIFDVRSKIVIIAIVRFGTYGVINNVQVRLVDDWETNGESRMCKMHIDMTTVNHFVYPMLVAL